MAHGCATCKKSFEICSWRDVDEWQVDLRSDTRLNRVPHAMTVKMPNWNAKSYLMSWIINGNSRALWILLSAYQQYFDNMIEFHQIRNACHDRKNEKQDLWTCIYWVKLQNHKFKLHTQFVLLYDLKENFVNSIYFGGLQHRRLILQWI